MLLMISSSADLFTGGRTAPNANPLTVMRGASATASDWIIAASAALLTV